MSITCCFVLILFCLPLHGFHSRPIEDRKPETNIQVSIKAPVNNGRKMGVDERLQSSSSSLKQVRLADQRDVIPVTVKGSTSNKPLQDRTKALGPDPSDQESLFSVSWRLPHKQPERHPGFNLDYASPRTHPPTHN